MAPCGWPDAAPVPHRRLSTRDAAEQGLSLPYGGWRQDYQQLSNGAFSGEVEDLALAPLTVVREAGNRIVLEAGALVPDAYALGVATAMEGEAHFCGSRYGAGCLAVLRPGAEFEMRSAAGFEVTAAVFHPGRLAALLPERAVECAALEAALLAMPAACHAPSAARLGQFLGALLATARSAPWRLVDRVAQIQVAAELLDLAGACASPERRTAVRGIGAGRQRTVRRVRAYLAARIQETGARPDDAPATVVELCQRLAVDRRTLQNSMLEVLGVAPHAYLKAVRLHAVRHALRGAPAGAAIADIAARHGFWHPSQFALDYRRLFGEHPSATRRRAGCAFSDS